MNTITLQPSYRLQHRIGKAKYIVSFHDGVKTHADGSPFFDVSLFRNKRTLAAFISDLESKGYAKP